MTARALRLGKPNHALAVIEIVNRLERRMGRKALTILPVRIEFLREVQNYVDGQIEKTRAELRASAVAE